MGGFLRCLRAPALRVGYSSLVAGERAVWYPQPPERGIAWLARDRVHAGERSMADQVTGQEPGAGIVAGARVAAVTVLLVVVALAFAGMGVFMFNMGRDMSAMTSAVSQMGIDVSSMAVDMDVMVVDMDLMADSMVEGQAGISGELARVRAGTEWMAADMRRMNTDIDSITSSIRGMSGNVDGMDASVSRMTHATGAMSGSMDRISVDMNRMTRPESLMPMTPFR